MVRLRSDTSNSADRTLRKEFKRTPVEAVYLLPADNLFAILASRHRAIISLVFRSTDASKTGLQFSQTENWKNLRWHWFSGDVCYV